MDQVFVCGPNWPLPFIVQIGEAPSPFIPKASAVAFTKTVGIVQKCNG